MRVVIIGGTGHVGTYLVPYLVEASMRSLTLVGSNVSLTGRRTSAWKKVQQVNVDRDRRKLQAHLAGG